MANKIVFIAFAKEDEASRNLFTGQRVHPNTPFEFDDMSVKEPYNELALAAPAPDDATSRR